MLVVLLNVVGPSACAAGVADAVQAVTSTRASSARSQTGACPGPGA